MSNSAYIAQLAYVSQQVVTYVGMTTVVTGVLGNLLNVLVFLSLKTFRENSCAFYLTVMSFVNIGQLLTGQLTRVMLTGFNNDWISISLFYCKFRAFGFQVFAYISFTCLCLATVDQFLATCVRVYWQQWSNIRVAQRSSIFFVVFWILYGIPYLIFQNHTISATTGKASCAITDMTFRSYHAYMNNIILSGGLPVCITILFGSLAFKNVRHIAYRTVPLVRRELDKQLTNMVLIQVVFSCCFILPYLIGTALPLATNLNNDPVQSAGLSLALNVSASIYYFYFACPFYIYFCVSDRFRSQFFYVLYERFFHRLQRKIAPAHQTLQQPTEHI